MYNYYYNNLILNKDIIINYCLVVIFANSTALVLIYLYNLIKYKKTNNDTTEEDIIDDTDDKLIELVREYEDNNNCKLIIIIDSDIINSKDIEEKHSDIIINIDNDIKFLEVIYKLNKYKLNKLEIIIHTIGGYIKSSNIIHTILFNNNLNTRAYIPIIGYSAGTLLSLSCKKIYMNKYALLSPTDPQIVINTNDITYKVSCADFSKVKTKKSNLILNKLQNEKNHNENLEYINNILDKKNIYNKDYLIKLLASGDYSHEKPITKQILNKNGLNIKKIPDTINNIFDTFLETYN